MKLGLDSLRDPTKILDTWNSLAPKPFGKQLFSRMLGLMAPYTGTISPLVVELSAGHARVQIRDRWSLRNHLRSVHAIALMNLGEATTGLAVMSLVPAGGRGIPRELNMEYIKKARGTITAESTVTLPTEPGTHDVDVVGELRNSIGEVVAKIRARWRIDLPARTGASASVTGASAAAPAVSAEDAEVSVAATAAVTREVGGQGTVAATQGVVRVSADDEARESERVTEGTPPAGDVPDEVAGEPVTEGTPPAGDVPDERAAP
jgi:acyl-coenzyme A thioesterase PaaI-like protein